MLYIRHLTTAAPSNHSTALPPRTIAVGRSVMSIRDTATSSHTPIDCAASAKKDPTTPTKHVSDKTNEQNPHQPSGLSETIAYAVRHNRCRNKSDVRGNKVQEVSV
jgi:hypothetical protein